MNVVVQDASVLIDLVSAEMLGHWYRLSVETLTTSLVWREVNRKHQKTALRRYVETGSLRIEPIGADVMTHIVQLQAELTHKISLEDASVLHVAATRSAILLTSDNALRRHAEGMGVEVHGLLWVLDLLVSREKILPGVAADRLEQLTVQPTSRLPKKECRRRITKWRSQ